MLTGLRKSWLLGLCSLLLCFATCHWEDAKKNGVDERQAKISVVRFDQMLNEYVESNSFSSLSRMRTECPQETRILLEDIIGLGEVDDERIYEKMKVFFSDTVILSLMRDASVKFKDMHELERQFTEGFHRLKEEVPSVVVPCVYSQFSALNESVVVADSLLGFSIDKYLGADYPLYKRYYYEYQRRSMTPERILPDCFAFYLMSLYPFPKDGERSLLDVILHLGKIHYAVSVVLGHKSAADELGYTAEEAAWCQKNEKRVWAFMLDHKHLSATDPMIIRKYCKASPYTAFFGEGSPSMTGVWTGMQIVASYMDNHEEVSLGELLGDIDYRRMLAESEYRP